MRIDGNQPNQDRPSVGRLDGTPVDRDPAPGRVVDKPGDDRVAISTAAELVTTAIRAAEDAPAIRQDVVERLRQKLERGEIGADLRALADRLIDNLLGK